LDKDFEEMINKMNKARNKVDKFEKLKQHDKGTEAKQRFSELKEKVDSFSKYRGADFYNLDEKKFIFYKQRLFSKGLLIDNPSNRIATIPFQAMGISEFGKEFVKFIERPK
jgi:hypothetical protein